MKDQDFGFYGKGAAGYAHYKQDFDRIHGGGGPGGGGNGPGCLGCVMVLAGVPVMLAVLAVLAGFSLLLNHLF